MKIGIDGRCLNTKRAMARYTKNLLNQFSRIDETNQYFLFVEGRGRLNEIKGLNLSKNWKIVVTPPKVVLRDHFFFKNSGSY